MKKKNALWTSLVISLFFTVAMVGIAHSDPHPGGAVVRMVPNSVEVPDPGVGLSCNMGVKIENVTGMSGYEIMVFWDRTLVNYTSAVHTPPTAWTAPHILKNQTDQTYNATHGRHWLACANLPAIAVTGNFTVLNITFTAISVGGPSSVSVYYPGYSYPAKLSDIGGYPIPCTTEDGEIEVVPEFPAGLIIPLLMVTTLVAAVLGKKAWVRKRRSSFVAK